MDINTINIVTLAYLGDAVYEIYIREKLINKGIAKVEELTSIAKTYVSAKGQAKILTNLLDKILRLWHFPTTNLVYILSL